MKSWKAGIILSLFGSALFAATPLQALPESQIVDKLKGIPVFALTDRDGLLVTASNGVRGRLSKGGAFFSQNDAKDFLRKLQRESPSLAKELEVRTVLLSDVYKAQMNLDPKQQVDIVFIPNQFQVKIALALVQKIDPKIKQFTGVPLFVAKTNRAGYLTAYSNNNKPVVPLFFDRDQLQPMIDKFKKQQPNAVVEVEVLTLERLLDDMRTKNDPLYERLALGPSREGLEILRSKSNTSSVRGVILSGKSTHSTLSIGSSQ
jgi:Tic22-like family